MEKKFNIELNFAVFVFLAAYILYTAYLFIMKSNDAVIVLCGGVIFLLFFYGFRPCQYVVDKKSVTIKYRLWKNKEIDLMECETICDPVERFSEIVRRPHAIEIYTSKRKRYPFFPKERVEFVESVMRANKRIHCTVKDYTDVHRKLEKKLRKEKRKAERQAAQDKESK